MPDNSCKKEGNMGRLYKRFTAEKNKLSPPADVEAAIITKLFQEKVLVDDPDLPISSYNYSAMRDRLLAKYRAAKLVKLKITEHSEQRTIQSYEERAV